MQLRYNYRLYPTPSQQQSLARAFGCARVVFNDGLRARQTARENGERYLLDRDLSEQVITRAKDTPERAWLSEVSSVVLQQALADLNVAYRNFFASISGRRDGRRLGPPRFRSRKDSRQAIRFTKNSRFAVLDSGRLRLPKIGDVDVRWSRSLPADPSSVTIIKDAAGRYFASFVVATADEPLPEADSEVGIDLGLTHFAVLSDGTKVTAPKFLRCAARNLKRLQQDLARKATGSKRRKKAVVKVARAHARVADTRRDWQHKLSTRIIRDNQAVYVEDLCVAGLGRTRLAKSVHDAGWSQFVSMLEYKAARYGRTFGKVDRFFPSTRLCSNCGRINQKMALNVRSWTCPCGSTHDRDVNAATIRIGGVGADLGRSGQSNAWTYRGGGVNRVRSSPGSAYCARVALTSTIQAAEILSTLAEPSRLGVLAELARRGSDGASLGELATALGLPAKVVGASVARLVAVGVAVRVENSYCAQLAEMRDVVSRLDAMNPISDLLEEYPRLKGVFSHGRLVSTPELSVHGHDLAVLVGKLIGLDGTADETEINRRLSVVSDDVALLRRLLVDEGVWRRDAAGTTYRPAAAAGLPA